MSARMPMVYGDSYGDAARNAISAQALDDSLLANMLANRARTRDADFQEKRFTSDDDYRHWVAAQEQAYRDKALAQSGDQFNQNLNFNRSSKAEDNAYRNSVQASDLDYRNRALAQSGQQFQDNLGFQREGRGMDQTYRYDALGQSGDQFAKNLAYQQQGRQSDDAYRYSSLNQQANQFNAAQQQAANQRAMENRLAMMNAQSHQYNQDREADYRDRSLAQNDALALAQLKQQGDVNKFNNDRLTHTEAQQTAQHNETRTDNLYKELTTNISNGVIHTPDELDQWENGQLSDPQRDNLMMLLSEANRRQYNGYEGTVAKADALNAMMTQKLSPLQTAAQKELDAAVPEENQHWYNWNTWGKKNPEEAQKSLPVTQYDTQRQAFLDDVGKSKAYRDLMYDPVGKSFVPLQPAPVGYRRPSAVEAIADDAPPEGTPPTGQPAPRMEPVKVTGTNISMDPKAFNAMAVEMAKYTNLYDRMGVRDKYLKDALANNMAWDSKPSTTDYDAVTDSSWYPGEGNTLGF